MTEHSTKYAPEFVAWDKSLWEIHLYIRQTSFFQSAFSRIFFLSVYVCSALWGSHPWPLHCSANCSYKNINVRMVFLHRFYYSLKIFSASVLKYSSHLHKLKPSMLRSQRDMWDVRTIDDSSYLLIYGKSSVGHREVQGLNVWKENCH